MSEQERITSEEIELRARWLAYLHQLDKDRVASVLKTTRALTSTKVMDDCFTYYEWSPSLEKALLFGRPSTVLKLFENADPDAIQEWIMSTEKLLEGVPIDFPSVEDLCRWEAEKYLLPD